MNLTESSVLDVHQDASGTYTCALVSHETFITHNGDLDFYEWHGVVYPLDDVFIILEKVLHCKQPATVDSMGVAGLLDLLRNKGLWFQSVRYAYIKGGLANVGNLTTTENLSQFWNPSTLNAIVNEFELRWKKVSGKKPAEAREDMFKTMLAAAANIDFKLPASAGKVSDVEGGKGNSGPELLVKAAVDAFFDQDLYTAGKEFLAHAEGSFGLCLSSSVDAANEVVLGARGQTISIAFWPKLGVLTWGSEAAGTKTGLGQEMGANRTGAAETDLMDGFRFDLDEVNGEIVRLCWETEAPDDKYKKTQVAPSAPDNNCPAIESNDPTPPNTSVMKYGEGVMGNVRVTHCIEGHNGSKAPFMKRVLRMGGNPYVEPLPDLSIKDKVGADIADIPKICKKIIDDWDEPSESINRLAAPTLLTKLRKRLVMHQTKTHDGAVDLLIVVPASRAPALAASRGAPTWRGEALIVTRNRTDFCIKLPTDAPALVDALAASTSWKPNKATELLLREDDLTLEGAALFGAWPDATFHQNFSFPVKFSKPTGAASCTAGPTTLKHIGAAADAEFASFDETSRATKIGDPSPEESFTIAAHSEIEELLVLHPSALAAAPSSTSPGTPNPDGSAASAAPDPLPPRAWLHHDVHEALLKLQSRASASASSAAIEAATLLAAVRDAAVEGSEPVTGKEGQDAIATMGERGWVVLSAAAVAGEAMEVEGDDCSAALATLRARGWLVGSSSEEECIASLVARGAAEGSESTEVSAEEASAAVRTLCAAGRCFVRDSTPREWEKFVFELRRREQDKAVGLLTEELDDVDGWCSRLDEMAGRGGAVGERVSGRIKQPRYGRPEVSAEWPRALLDAPCAWGKTVGSIKVAVELFKKHLDLGTVAVFEHRLDLIKRVMEEWAKWAKILGVELEMFTECSLSLAGEGDGRPAAAKRARTSAAGASSSTDGGGGAASGEQEEDEDEEEAGDEQRARDDPDAVAAEKKMGATRLQDAAAVKQKLGTPPPSGKLRVLFVCYDSTFLLRDAYDVNSGDVPEPLGLAIFDEAHEMAAGGGDSKEHLHALALYDKNVPIRRRLFMTATPKVAMVKQASDDAKEEGESLALSMGEEEVYGSEHVEQCDESGRRDVVRGRKYSMRFDEAITRGLITDYKFLVISVDGKREVIESLANARLSTEDGSPFAEQLAEWKRRHAKPDPKDSQKKLEPEVDALEVAKVKALEDALVHQGLQKVFVFSSLKQWAELFGILAAELIVEKSQRETSSDAEAAAPPLLVPDKVHVVHSTAEYRAHEGFKKKNAASARAKREGSGYDAVEEFGASAPPAVLSNVRSLGTGTDCPRVDGTMFGTSKGNSIGAVQEAGRSFRLDLPTFDASGKVVVHAGNKTKVAKVLMCIFEGEADPAATGKAPKSSRKAPKPSKAVKRDRKAGGLHPSSSGGDRGSVMNVLKAFQGVDTRMDGLVRSAHRVLINGRERELTDVLSDKRLARLGERVAVMGMDEAKKVELTTSVLDACVPPRTWDDMYEKLRDYKEANGSCNVPQRLVPLGPWVNQYKMEYRQPDHGRLRFDGRLEKLRALGAIADWEAEQKPRTALDWDEMYEKLKAYKQKVGNCSVSPRNTEYPQLGQWVANQKAEYKKKNPPHGSLSQGDRLARLQALGAIADWQALGRAGQEDAFWEEMYKKLEAYQAHVGDCNVPLKYKDDPQLGGWVNKQREQYRMDGHGKLARGDRLARLRQLGAIGDWEDMAGAGDARWQHMFEKLQAYKEANGNCNVPDGYEVDKQLATWVRKQKKNAKGDRLAKLQELGAIADWEDLAGANDVAWQEKFERLQAYKEANGDCNVPQRYDPDQQLATWLREQKTMYNKPGHGSLARGHRLAKMRELGAIADWEAASDEAKWLVMYEKLREYKEAHGSCSVPRSDPQLGNWVEAQRAQYRKEGRGSLARGGRLEKLEELGAIGDWEAAAAGRTPATVQTWEEVYERLAAYKEANGHCNVPQEYATDQQLATWVNSQKTQYRKDGHGTLVHLSGSVSRLDKLQELGAADDWDAATADGKWQEMFEKLKAYKEKEGHCDVPSTYPEDKTLASWVVTQRVQYKQEGHGNLAGARLKKLQELGAIADWLKVMRGAYSRKVA